MVLKEIIKTELLKQARLKLEEATKAYETSRDLTTSSEFKSEGKYDTRAIESGYLAGAQKARVESLKIEIERLENIPTSETSHETQVGSILKLESDNKIQNYFLCPSSGGSQVFVESEAIQVISLSSPLGRALIGLSSGDSFELETPKGIREFSILSLK